MYMFFYMNGVSLFGICIFFLKNMYLVFINFLLFLIYIKFIWYKYNVRFCKILINLVFFYYDKRFVYDIKGE